MDDNPKNPGDSSGDVEELRRRLAEAEGTLDAIRRGMVDAFVVEDGQGERVYTLKGADKAYNVFIETINEGLVALDSSNNILYSNTAFAHLVGSSPDRVSGSSAHRFIQEEDRPLFDRLMAQSIGGITSRREFSILTETGDLVPMCLSFSNLEIAGINGACIVLTDLTEQKHAARDLQEQYSVLSSILESSNSPIFSIDADYLYSSFNNSHAAAMKALYEADIELGKSILAYMTIEEDRIEAKRNLDRALQGGQFVESAYSGDEDHSRKYFEVSHNPIRNKRGEVTGVAVFAIDNTESKRAEETLRKSEEKYRLLYDNAGEAIFSYDPELRLTDINRVACEAIGYSREEILGKNVLELNILHPRDLELAATLISRHFAGENVLKAEYSFIRKDGSERLFSLIGAAIRDPDGNLQSITNMCRDITERKAAEEELRLKESAISTSINGIAIADMERRLTYVNRAFLDLHGYESLDEVLGREIVEFVEDERELAPVMSELLEKGSWVGGVKARKKDGSLFDGQFTTSVIVDDRGKPVAMLATMLDITERKQAEKVLEESESRFRLLTEKMGDLLWTTDLRMNSTYVSPSVEAILGFTPDEYSKVPLQERVTPESLQSSGEILTDELQGDKKRDPGRSYVIDLDFYHKDGSVRNMETSLSLIRDDNGDPVGIYGLSRDVTERKQAEETLKEKKARLEAINNEAMDALLLVDKKGILHHWNPAAERIFGYSPEESLGRSIEIWIPEPHQREYVDAIAEFINTGVQRLTSKEPTEFVALKRDGTEIYTEIAVSRLEISDEWYAELTVRDITERKEAKSELLKLEGELYLALNTLPDLMFEVDSGGLIHDYHAPQTDMLYISPSDFIGKTVEEALPENASRSIMDAISNTAVRTKGHGYATYSLEMPDGTHWYEASIAPKGNIGNDRLVALVRDTTERKLVEEVTERHSRELEAANTELESFSYSVSHDLRAPLRAVKGFGKMLLKEHSEELDEEGRKLLDIIISNTEFMEGLIEGLLVLSGINRQDLRMDNLDMTSLAKDCIGELDVEGRDVEFIVHNLPSAEGGRTLVRQVFLNLIANAVKFTGKKEKAVIEIGSETQNGQDVYFVKDNGDGFDMKHSDNLFGVFKRLHKEDEFPGLGIGLATVQRIINRHGGKVWAEGKKGEGATFYFTLPCSPA